MYLRIILLTAIFWAVFLHCGFAQKGDSIESSEMPSLSFIEKLDSNLLSYIAMQRLNGKKTTPIYFDSGYVPQYTDSVYAYRFQKINSAIPLDFNAKTRRYVDVYVREKRSIVPYMLSVSSYYFPIFEEELDRQGLPLELKYLPVIESGLKAKIVSKSGAVGLWQIMYWTGKSLGLQMTSYVDERRDPRKSTKAAVKYLKDLYAMYGDWQLAMAAYNCGPGNVNKAIRKAGGDNYNFWEIYQYLPSETRGYVPAFIAATYLFNYYREHNFEPIEVDFPIHVDTVMVDYKVHLEDLASIMDIPYPLLQELNPQYKLNVVPGSPMNPYVIALPTTHCLTFCDYSDTLCQKFLQKEKERTTTPTYNTTNATGTNLNGKTKIYYIVKSGDNLSYMAVWFDTNVSRIKEWNGLYSNNLRVGQKLAIYVPSEKIGYYNNINMLSFAEKQALDGESSKPSEASADTKGYIHYTIKAGDSLWNVVQRFPGNTVDEVKALNGLTNSSTLKPGMVIKLYKNS